MNKIAQDVLSWIDKNYISQQEKNRKDYEERHGSDILNKRFMPSFISTNSCLRAWTYHYKGEPETDGVIDPRFIRVTENGKSIHNRIQQLLINHASLTPEHVEFKLKDETWKISGSIDIILTSKFGQKFVLEIKSINSHGFESVIKNDQPQPSHRLQVNIYLWVLSSVYSIQCTGGLVYYENKDTQEHTAFFVELDQEIIDKIKEKFKAVFTHCETQTLPNMCYTASNSECRYCRYATKCKSDGGSQRSSLISLK